MERENERENRSDEFMADSKNIQTRPKELIELDFVFELNIHRPTYEFLVTHTRNSESLL